MVLCHSVVGEKEQQNETVNIRTRDNKVHGEHSVTHVLQRFKHFTDSKVLDAEEKFWIVYICLPLLAISYLSDILSKMSASDHF